MFFFFCRQDKSNVQFCKNMSHDRTKNNFTLPLFLCTGQVVGAHRPCGSWGEDAEGCDTGGEHEPRGLERPRGGAAEQRQCTGSGLLPHCTGARVQLPYTALHHHPPRALKFSHTHTCVYESLERMLFFNHFNDTYCKT